MTKEVLKLALEELIFYKSAYGTTGNTEQAIAAIKEALLCKYGNEPASCTSSPMDCQCALDATFAAPQGEPYGIVYEYDGYGGVHRSFRHYQRNGSYPTRTVTVYEHPAPAPLSDSEIDRIYTESAGQHLRPQDLRIVQAFAYAIERHVRGAKV